MNRKLTMQDFIYKKIAVTFDSLEQEKEFLKLCAAEGLRWRTGERADKIASSILFGSRFICRFDVETHCHHRPIRFRFHHFSSPFLANSRSTAIFTPVERLNLSV